MFYGFDMDRTMLRIGAMNLMQHGIENPNIMYKDSLSEDNEDNGKYTLVLANPPFKGSIDAERTSKDLLAVTKTKKTDRWKMCVYSSRWGFVWKLKCS